MRAGGIFPHTFFMRTCSKYNSLHALVGLFRVKYTGLLHHQITEQDVR
jgi:hypothetical protein